MEFDLFHEKRSHSGESCGSVGVSECGNVTVRECGNVGVFGNMGVYGNRGVWECGSLRVNVLYYLNRFFSLFY